MNKENEQKVLSTLYNRLFEAITYSPGDGKTAVFDKDTTFVQFSKNEALNSADFTNATTPSNPGGDQTHAEMFSSMVDVIPAIQADYTPTQNHVSKIYKTIVDGANSDTSIDPTQQEIYNKAYNYLNKETKIKDFTGKETVVYGPSDIYQTYQNNQTAYIAAVSAYRTAYLGYDLTKPDEQKKWQANEPLLQNAVSQTYNTWRAQGAPQVEEALAAINTSINSSVRNALNSAQQAVKSPLPSNVAGGSPWYMTYALPTNWYDASAAANFSDLTLSSSYLDAKADSSYTSYGGGASWSAGLWSVGGSVSGHKESTHFHMDASNLSLHAKIGVVRIYRPWLNEFIFRMKHWFIDATNKNGISNGQLKGNEDGLMPLIPTAFVVARDIEIEADFTSQDKTHVESSISTSARVGWGPFAISGHYSHSSSKDTFKSTFDGGTLKVPGIQILAWVSEIVPASPPENKP